MEGLPVSDRLQIKRDIFSVWTSVNPVLSDGEFGFERDTNLLKIGNGSTPWNGLPYLPVLSTQATAGEALGGHRVVVLTPSGLMYASATNINHVNRIVGITLSAYSSGVPAYYTREGIVTEPSWTWNTTSPIYLADTGLLTQTPVNTTGFVMIVAMPLTSTSIYFSLKTPILL
jgi:Major tropism determinant N-terminal domain